MTLPVSSVMRPEGQAQRGDDVIFNEFVASFLTLCDFKMYPYLPRGVCAHAGHLRTFDRVGILLK